MQRLSASRRQVLALALAASVAGGIGYGAYTLGSAAGTDTVTFASAGSSSAGSAGATTTTASLPSAEATESSPLTLDEATALAVEAAPGTVIEWDEDLEPTGLRYDVTVLHTDGTTTDVEVDTVTGLVTSIDHDDDRD